jgi:hypothetical protein
MGMIKRCIFCIKQCIWNGNSIPRKSGRFTS